MSHKDSHDKNEKNRLSDLLEEGFVLENVVATITEALNFDEYVYFDPDLLSDVGL